MEKFFFYYFNFLFYFWNLFFCVHHEQSFWKQLLTEVDNVSFSAHPREWLGLSQLLVERQKQLMWEAIIFRTQLCVPRKQLLPCLIREFRICSSALSCFCLLTDSTSSDWKKERREMVLLFVFLQSPQISLGVVWCLENTCYLKCRSIFNY